MKMIEFLGMPRAGKTTQIERLRAYLVSQGKRVAVITDRERAQRVHVRPIEGLAYVLSFFTFALDEYYQHEPDTDYLLVDRGFNDVEVWAEVRLELGEITQAECQALQTCFERFKTLVERTFLFDVSVEESLQRHAGTGEKQDVDAVAMNEKWLRVIHGAYDKQAGSFHNVVRVDGTRSPDEAEQLVREALGV